MYKRQAYIDNCTDCVGGDTGLVECVQDCAGVWGGTSVLDDCGVCGGDSSSCWDCANVPNGPNTTDNCGDCDDDATNDCVQDECGVWGGTGTIDMCGVCDEDASNDCTMDDCGVWGGTGSFDMCGVCDEDVTNDCVQDECGIWGGSGIPTYFCNCEGTIQDLDLDGICDPDDDCIDLTGAGCVFYGCMDPTNPGYDPIATEDDGSCLLGGCTIFVACNFNPLADYQTGGACDFSSCAGCMDVSACNYDIANTLADNNLCLYADMYLDCDGNCLNDTDGDSVCDELEVVGCTDSTNPAYNEFATESDDSMCLQGGCLLPYACNYEPAADYIDISLCDFTSCAGCTITSACNYDSSATISSAALCTFPTNPFRACDGLCLEDADGDGICDEIECALIDCIDGYECILGECECMDFLRNCLL